MIEVSLSVIFHVVVIVVEIAKIVIVVRRFRTDVSRSGDDELSFIEIQVQPRRGRPSESLLSSMLVFTPRVTPPIRSSHFVA